MDKSKNKCYYAYNDKRRHSYYTTTIKIVDDELEELFRETRNIWGEPNPFDIFIEEAV